ncbi:MAG: transcriptional regulator PpsR [Methylobacteriaceae bacterium]|nr:transcriptional regulator PpsR [Methylobacteriaceae bacterium]
MNVARAEMGPLHPAWRSLGELDADIAGRLVAAAADVALIVEDGVVRNVASHSDELAQLGIERWVGRPWVETVTVESRPKVEALLAGTRDPQPRSRQVNHPVPGRPDIPILYAAVPVGEPGRIVAVGRDLRVMAAMQQRLVDAQQSVEREYARLRNAETRYRMLFQIASEAVVIVDAVTGKVTEANPSTAELLGQPEGRIVGRPLTEILNGATAEAAREALARVRTTGRSEEVSVALARTDRRLRMTVSLFRQERSVHFLLRLVPNDGAMPIILPSAKSKLLSVVESLPDGFVVAGLDKRILAVNTAFLELAQVSTEELARGEPLDRWLGRSGVDVNVLVASLREHGAVRRFGTVVRGEYGSIEEVEVSAVAVEAGDPPCFGLTIRSVGRRPSAAPDATERSVSHLTELVGRVSLKDLVRETTDVIEKLCIEAALQLTEDNRASAAEMLGLSRQSLYAKLRRYGLGDLGPDEEP